MFSILLLFYTLIRPNLYSIGHPCIHIHIHALCALSLPRDFIFLFFDLGLPEVASIL